jgi:hypothetical protein
VSASAGPEEINTKHKVAPQIVFVGETSRCFSMIGSVMFQPPSQNEAAFDL